LSIPVCALSKGLWHPDEASILVEHRSRVRRTDGLGRREMSWWWSVVFADCGHHCHSLLHPVLHRYVLLLGEKCVGKGWRVDQQQDSGSGNDDPL